MTDMRAQLAVFIGQKNLSANSLKAYGYDLEQFCQMTGGVVTQQTLMAYRQFLSGLSLSAQKRKCSAVNQFLYDLYQQGLLSEFYKISPLILSSSASSRVMLTPVRELLDWSVCYRTGLLGQGHLLTLLILELGLTPSELLALKVTDIDLTFRLIRVTYRQQVRVLPLPEVLVPYLEPCLTGTYLFDNAGNSYTRQWVSGQLSAYLLTIGRSEMTAQRLREQFILTQVAKGLSQMDLAKHLGLKTSLTLEKYYQTDGY